jgi:hypothetical protein
VSDISDVVSSFLPLSIIDGKEPSMEERRNRDYEDRLLSVASDVTARQVELAKGLVKSNDEAEPKGPSLSLGSIVQALSRNFAALLNRRR